MVYLQFDRGSQDEYSMGGFIILGGNMNKMVRARHYYDLRLMNSKTKCFMFCNALNCLIKISCWEPNLYHLVSMFGDCKLMIRFITLLFKKPICHSTYWALEQTRNTEYQLGVSVAYQYVS